MPSYMLCYQTYISKSQTCEIIPICETSSFINKQRTTFHAYRKVRSPVSFSLFRFRYFKVGIKRDVERQKDDFTGISYQWYAKCQWFILVPRKMLSITPPLNAPNTSTSLQLPWHRCQHGFEILHCTPWRHRSSSTTKGVKLQWIYRYHVLWPGNITTNSTLANWMCFLLQVWKGQKNWRTRYVRVVSPELNEGMEPTSPWAWSIMICLKRKYLLILVYWYAYLLSLR